jgi:multidrug efflux pump subunit AcrB
MIGDLTSSPEPMEVKLFSQDPNVLKQWAPKLGEKLKKTPHVVDVKDGIENTITGPAIVMNVDPVVAARAGFTPQEVELDASNPARRARHDSGGRERSFLHDPRPFPG